MFIVSLFLCLMHRKAQAINSSINDLWYSMNTELHYKSLNLMRLDICFKTLKIPYAHFKEITTSPGDKFLHQMPHRDLQTAGQFLKLQKVLIPAKPMETNEIQMPWSFQSSHWVIFATSNSLNIFDVKVQSFILICAKNTHGPMNYLVNRQINWNFKVPHF